MVVDGGRYGFYVIDLSLEYGIYSVGVRNLFRWSTEFIPLEYGIYSVGVRNLFRVNGRNKFRTPTAWGGINSVLQLRGAE